MKRGKIQLAKYEELCRAIEEAVRKACEGKRIGVAFSGGMDSGLVAALIEVCQISHLLHLRDG